MKDYKLLTEEKILSKHAAWFNHAIRQVTYFYNLDVKVFDIDKDFYKEKLTSYDDMPSDNEYRDIKDVSEVGIPNVVPDLMMVYADATIGTVEMSVIIEDGVVKAVIDVDEEVNTERDAERD